MPLVYSVDRTVEERVTKGHTNDIHQEEALRKMAVGAKLFWLQIAFAPAQLFMLQRVQPFYAYS